MHIYISMLFPFLFPSNESMQKTVIFIVVHAINKALYISYRIPRLELVKEY